GSDAAEELVRRVLSRLFGAARRNGIGRVRHPGCPSPFLGGGQGHVGRVEPQGELDAQEDQEQESGEDDHHLGGRPSLTPEAADGHDYSPGPFPVWIFEPVVLMRPTITVMSARAHTARAAVIRMVSVV